MATIHNRLIIVSIAIGCTVFAGCNDSSNPKPTGFPTTVPCVVTITQEGTPLVGAMVSLIPSDGAKDWLFDATTDASGRAKIFTYGRKAGAPKGKYKVVVNKTETEPSKYTMPDENDVVAVERYYRDVINEKLNSYTLVESEYTEPGTTPLTLEVAGKTAETFEVGKQVRHLLPAH